MRLIQTAGLLGLSLALGACFQSTTVLHVNGDRSGTLLQRSTFTGAALAQFRQFAQMAGSSSRTPELISEDQARAMVSNLGPGARFVSSTPIQTETTEGRETLYAFPDVTKLKISQQPPGPGGVTVRADNLGPPQDITFAMEPQPNGNQVLHIRMPDFRKLPGMPGNQASVTGRSAAEGPSEQQLETARQMFAGMRILIAVEPEGRVVATSSPYVEGNRVTLLDFDFDRLAANPESFDKLRALKTPDDVQTFLKDVPGVKFTLDRDVTVEFAPGK